ncbi:MAG: hypothetical protein V4736_00075 [Bdellovibrionota bacterium]
MMASILLIGVPSLCAFVFCCWAAYRLRSSNRVMKSSDISFIVVNALIIELAVIMGAIVGLVLAIKIDGLFFDHEILQTALPGGTFLWYGFGPGMTPQFQSYAAYLLIICCAISGVFLPARSTLPTTDI